METLLTTVWLGVGMIVLWPATEKGAHWLVSSKQPNGADWVIGGFIGLILAACWPVAFPFALSYLIWKWAGRWFA